VEGQVDGESKVQMTGNTGDADCKVIFSEIRLLLLDSETWRTVPAMRGLEGQKYVAFVLAPLQDWLELRVLKNNLLLDILQPFNFILKKRNQNTSVLQLLGNIGDF
jgi:hypothetical protein